MHAIALILHFRSWLKKLPDEGDKIQNLYDRVIEALKRKDEIDIAENMLKNLNLESKDIANMEWEGRNAIKKQPIDSDDEEETDPLAILASSSSLQKKIIKHQKPPKPLITEQDLKEAEEIKNDHHLKLDHVLERCCKIENMDSDQRFLPYKSVKSSDHPHKSRDNTAASPPFLEQGTKALTIRESIEVENTSRKNVKIVTEKHAAERLAARTKELKLAGFKIETPSTSAPSNPLSMSKYRLPAIETEEAENSDDSDESSLSDDECENENV